MSRPCAHADAIHDVAPHKDVCETCVLTGDTWLHLRQCLTCGITLCCDSSPNRHASRHARDAGHPIMRSAEPDEDWVYCWGDDLPIQETPRGWLAFDPYVMEGTEAARVHLSSGIAFVAPLPVTVDGFNLGEWAEYVREQHAAGTLDPDDEAAIAGLPGWSW